MLLLLHAVTLHYQSFGLQLWLFYSCMHAQVACQYHSWCAVKWFENNVVWECEPNKEI